MVKKQKNKETSEVLSKQTSETSERLCDKEGCFCLGEYRAPKDNTLSEYYWFCLEHVKEYNAQWNFYKDMSETEIEKERKEDVCWHRPTWEFGQKGGHQKFSDPLNLRKEAFNENEEKKSSHSRPLTPEEKKLQQAATLLELDFPLELEKIRQNYKRLAKTYHPDSTGGDKVLEEKFKDITEAYQLIMKAL